MIESDKQYFRKHYHQLERKYDSSIIFIISMLAKLNKNGRLGFISSVTWQTGENYSKLREYLFTCAGVKYLVNLPFDVFKNAYVDTGVYILTKEKSAMYSIYRFPKKHKLPDMDNIIYTDVLIDLVMFPDYKIVLDPYAQNIFLRVVHNPCFTGLGNITISTQGLAPSRYKFEREGTNEKSFRFLMKGQVYRYYFNIDNLTYANMEEHQSLMKFYGANPKILIRRVINRQDRLMATFYDEELVLKKDINPFILTQSDFDPLFVLGILNSKLISYFYVNMSSIATKDDFRQTTLAELRRIPIPIMDHSRSVDKSRHDKMVQLVDRMLELHKK
jgi:hypothetical protein